MSTLDPLLQAMRDRGAITSDGPLPREWSEGWAVIPFATQKGLHAHWWMRSLSESLGWDAPAWRDTWSTLCGRAGGETYHAHGRTVMPLGPGTHERCRFCQRSISAFVRLGRPLPRGVAAAEGAPR